MKQMIVFDGYPWNVLGRIFIDVRHRFRQNGLLNALKYFPRRLISSDVVHYEELKVFKRPIPSVLIDMEAPVNGITYGLASPADISNYHQLFKYPSNINDHKRMFEAGDVTMLAFDGERLVGIVLASIWQDGIRPTETDFVVLNRALTLNTGKDALIHRLLVMPDYQGRGIGVELVNRVAHLMGDKSVQQTYCVVNTDNLEAINVFTQIGFEAMYDMTSIQFLNLQHIRLTPSIP